MANIHGSAPYTNNFYAAIGDQLIHFHVDIKTAKLKRNTSKKFGLKSSISW